MRAFQTIRGQKLNETKHRKRRESCQTYLNAITSGDLVPDNIIFSDEKLFRCVKASSGSGRNNRIWQPQSLKKSDVDDPRLYRESETWGKSVMVAMRAMGRGLIGPLFVEKGCKIEGAYYKESILSRYIPQARALFPEGKWVLQEDGAPERRKKGVKTLPKWPPTSPDLNACVYYLWPVTQKYVDDQTPRVRRSYRRRQSGRRNFLPKMRSRARFASFPEDSNCASKRAAADLNALAEGPGAVELYEAYVEFVEDECDQNKQEDADL